MNPHKGDVNFVVGEKTYTLRFSHLALVKLEKSLDKSLIQILAEITPTKSQPAKMRLGTVVALLWSGLQKHHPEMTEDDVAELLDEIDGGAGGAVKIIDDAFNKAFGTTPGTKGTNPQQKEVNGSGMTSSSNMLATDLNQTASGTSPQKN